MRYNDESFYEVKDPELFDYKIKESIRMLSSGNAYPFGSFIFKIQTYPSDLDLIEEVIKCCDPKLLYDTITIDFRNIVRKVINTKGYYYSESKAGYDHRYKIDIGSWNYSNMTWEEFDIYKIIDQVDELYKNDLLYYDEYDKISSYIYDETMDKYNKYTYINEFFRNLYTLRWTAEEVLNGYKKLRKGFTITFREAVTHKTPIKIDVITNINGRFVEVTNFFILVLLDKTGKKTMLNFEYDYENSIKKEIIKYDKSIKFKKPFKMAKRMWGIARYKQNSDYLNKLTPLFQSDIALLNQITSDIETLITLIEKVSNPPYEEIIDELDVLKNKLNSFYETKIDSDLVLNFINMINIGHISREEFKENILHVFESLKDYFKKIIGEETLKYLRYKGLYPLSSYFTSIQYKGGCYGNKCKICDIYGHTNDIGGCLCCGSQGP